MVNVNINFRVMRLWFVRQHGVSVELSIRNIPFEIRHRLKIIQSRGALRLSRVIGWDPK